MGCDHPSCLRSSSGPEEHLRLRGTFWNVLECSTHKKAFQEQLVARLGNLDKEQYRLQRFIVTLTLPEPRAKGLHWECFKYI
ncbi:hypothetical protein EYF80_042493 [Liparis tanakae]|uniref:Uncharacterized protein n=1 Tax=Liparis tanakae TaxID=230148 RepID=A0A4Z2G385_9TELE|nr:hypothetical protein EYF80_042493 [Liparis tanakae]